MTGVRSKLGKALVKLEDLGGKYFDEQGVPDGWMEVVGMEDEEGRFGLAMPIAWMGRDGVKRALTDIRDCLTYPV